MEALSFAVIVSTILFIFIKAVGVIITWIELTTLLHYHLRRGEEVEVALNEAHDELVKIVEWRRHPKSKEE